MDEELVRVIKNGGISSVLIANILSDADLSQDNKMNLLLAYIGQELSDLKKKL